MRAVYADHLEEISDPRAEFVRLELRWHEAISQLRELRPKIPADWRAPLRRQWGVELTSPGHLKLNVIKQVRGITGYGLREAKELVDDATIGKKPMVLQAVDLARAVAALEWLLKVESVQARIVEGTAEPIALYDFEPPAHGAPVDDARRLRWADSFGDDPRGAFIRAELAATRAAERLAALSRGLDAAWQVAVGRWWAVRLDGTERLDAEEVAPLRARFALAEPQWEERALLGRLPPWVMDGLDRRAADAVALAVADFPGVRAEVVRSPSRLAWLLGVERVRGASSP